jgi:alpha-1,2-mannosyltransferase
MHDLIRRLGPILERGDWLNRRRVAAYAAILLTFEVLAFLFVLAGTHGWVVKLDKPNTTDFVSFYAAGDLANSGPPQAAYDQPRHLAAEEKATEHGIGYVLFVYPPVFMLLCAALARLPYLAAFTLFEGGTLIPCLYVFKSILKEKDWRVLIPLLAFPAILINIGMGQNALLTAALFGGATLLIDRRPLLAGLLFGALCYKPHFGLLVPLALVAAGRWRAIGGAAFSAIGLVALSAAMLGTNVWQAFIVAITGSHTIYESGQVDFAAFVSAFGAVRLIGGSPDLAYIVQAVSSVTAGLLVAVVWRRGLSLPLRAATLAAGTLTALPLILFYDFVLAGVAIVWLVRAGRETGFMPWEKLTLTAVFAAPLLSRGIGTSTHVPIATFAALALLVLCAARAWRELHAPRAARSYGEIHGNGLMLGAH